MLTMSTGPAACGVPPEPGRPEKSRRKIAQAAHGGAIVARRGGPSRGGPAGFPRYWGAPGIPGPSTAVPYLGDAPTLPGAAPATRAYGPAMEIGRRGLLGLGAAVVASAATSSCRDSTVTGGPAPSTSPPSSQPPTPGPSFAGRPTPGTMYYGASVPHNRSLSGWEDELGSTLALHRSYFTPDHNETAQLVHQLPRRPGARPAAARVDQADLGVAATSPRARTTTGWTACSASSERCRRR